MVTQNTPKSYPLYIGIVTLIGSMLSISLGNSFAKGLFHELGAEGTTFYRLFFSAILLWLAWRPWRFSLNWQQFKLIAAYGISLGLLNFFFYLALQTIPLGIAVAIEFCGPLGLALFASRKKVDFIWIILVIIGLLFLIPNNLTGTDSLDTAGLVYISIAALLWALYIVIGQRMSGIHPGQASAWGISISSLTVLPFAIHHLGFEDLWHPELLGIGFIVGLLSSAIPYSLEMIALRSLERKTFGVLLSLEPAFSTVVGAIILHEYLTLQQMTAIVCIIVASMGCTLTAKRK